MSRRQDWPFRLSSFFRGWLKVRIKTSRPEETISRATGAHVSLWDVRRTPDGLDVRMRLSDVRALWRVTKGTGTRLRFRERRGFPFWIKRTRHRPFLWVGAVLAAVLLIYITSRVWVVDVGTTVSASEEAQLVAVAEQAGLRPGAVRAALPLARIERDMLRQLPQYTWLGISIRGAVAVLRVYRFVPRPASTLAHRLVAQQKARVTAVHVYIGQALVSPGDTVRVGQPLIEGIVEAPALPDGQEPGSRLPSVTTVAEGEVIGEVHVSTTVYQPYRGQILLPTHQMYRREWVMVSGRAVQVSGFLPVPFRFWTSKTIDVPLKWQNIDLPATWVEVVYNEVIPVSVRWSRPMAVKKASQLAWANLRQRLVPGQSVISRKVSWRAGPRGVWATASAVISENIAVPAVQRHP